MPEYKRILVIRFSSLGDIILISPFLKVLRKKFPDSRIDYCTKSQYTDVLRLNPNINGIIEADDDLDFDKLKKLKKELSQNSYDLVIDLHNNLKTFYLKNFLKPKVKTLVFKKYSFKKFLLVKFKINLMKNLPSISSRYISTLEGTADLSESDYKTLPEIFTGEETNTNLEKILKENGIVDVLNLICIIPGSKHYTKTYPAERYTELINKYANNKFRFILTGTENDKQNIEIIKSGTEGNVIDLSGKLSILELTELMKLCRLVICGDTGPMHIAEALNVPLIAIMGSSVKEFGFYPQSANSVIAENNDIKCRPCSHVGRPSCPQGHFKCMREITSQEIFTLISAYVKNAP